MLSKLIEGRRTKIEAFIRAFRVTMRATISGKIALLTKFLGHD
jgi:hypothetical protein